LTYNIFNRALRSRQLPNGGIGPAALIFTGPSSLPNLEDLHITYRTRTIFNEAEDLNVYLDAIYLHNINRTIKDSTSFPSLRTFHAECTVRIDGSLVLDEEKLAQHVMDRLPAIFSVGGRRDSHGWLTSVVATVEPGVEHLAWET